ncbi:hypothetical protein NDU88_001830 [Pleurodeles waltl]|uniref:MHC class I antigen n=1 Tax=Pleurodeles waltl TaxID=8319 RepID=A0AAV7R886_PLEWA|nr:hypothetical protein NDU88_001830 [Pleurodeles waltl]
MKVVKVLNGEVQLEDRRVRNLRHVSLFKASNLSQESVCEDLDEESGYLWGYEGEDVWCVDRMWKVDIRSTRQEFGRWQLGETERFRERFQHCSCNVPA